MILVSVVVITYNSTKTIIETLESIKAQSYQNIELIVSDDCSNDNTVDLVREWLELNGSRFVNTEIVTTGKNTGVAGNINRGVAKSHGEWIKSIAGDDLLIPTAIEEYLGFVKNNKESVNICVSDVQCFSSEGNVDHEIVEAYDYYFKCEQEPYEQQWKRVCKELVFVGPTFFYSRELFNQIGGFSEEYGNCEEWPFVFKILKGGNPIFAINKKLVKYRVSANSLCHSNIINGLGNQKLFESVYRFFFDYPFKELLRQNRYLLAWHYLIMYKTKMYRFLSGDSKMSLFCYKYFVYLSPYLYLHKIRCVIGSTIKRVK